MNANKALLQSIHAELAKGNSRPLVEAMAEDFTWSFRSSGVWSGAYRGKRVVLEQLLGPLTAQFGDQYTSTAQRFIAEDDYVVVECQGRVTTKAGKPYHNRYCFIYRLADGKLKEVTEYMDTALAEAVLEPPRGVAA